MSLDEIKLNDVVVILKINDVDMKRRLYDLGFLPGEKIECILNNPFRNPRAYKINGAILALRDELAREIEVIYEED